MIRLEDACKVTHCSSTAFLLEYRFMYDMEITFQSLNQMSNYLLNVLTVQCGHKVIIQMYPFTSFHSIEIFHEYNFHPIKLRHKCVLVMWRKVEYLTVISAYPNCYWIFRLQRPFSQCQSNCLVYLNCRKS